MTEQERQDIWQAFSTLSDAQDLMMEFNDIQEAHKQINHAKRHLMTMIEVWSKDERFAATNLNNEFFPGCRLTEV